MTANPALPDGQSTGLREAQKAQRRTAISRAAVRLAAERGYHQVTVADIAAEAGVSRRTISNYFPSKADCFVLDEEDQLLDHLAAELANGDLGGTRERLAAAFRSMPDSFWADCLTLYELQLDEPEIAAVTARNERLKCRRIVAEIIELSDGRIDRLRMAATVTAVASCLNAAMEHWLQSDGRGGVRALAGHVADSLSILDLSWLDPHLGLLHKLRADPS
ncbi:TetR/AcrR family transcriptional regulator [Cumulibacter manganitolerans]|uniref:TetR/AcrR family transcriptional regulator n=1 Tax=Cumulibacter manganitolerans TaxID=1884992 RepID=UPI0012958CC9|nr:TetR/AcrR family transcriptional regulator [Cumulibacter manganitolerans]